MVYILAARLYGLAARILRIHQINEIKAHRA
jgi:hypothetical protein